MDQHAAVAAVECPPEVAAEFGLGEGGGDGCADEPGDPASGAGGEVVEVAEQRRRTVERAVAAEEATVGEDAAPVPADEGGADQVRRLVRRYAEEDLLDELLRHQLHAGRRWLWQAAGSAAVSVGSVLESRTIVLLPTMFLV